MKINTLATIFLFLVFNCGIVFAKTEKTLPTIVQSEVNEMVKSCSELGGKFTRLPELLTTVDLTGDGISDYVLNQGAYQCDGPGASTYSGSGGSQVYIYVGSSDGQAYLAFFSGAFDVKINKATKPAKLQIVVAGKLCGQRNTEKLSNSQLKSCWRPIEWTKSELKMDFASLSQVKFIQ